MESDKVNNLQENKPPLKDSIDKYLQPALLIALTTAFCYYIGYSYVSAYFARLGIHDNIIDLPSSYYIMKSLFGIMIGLIIVYFLWVHKRNDMQNKRLRSFKENSIILVLAIPLIYQAITDHNYYLLGIGLFMIIIYCLSVYENRFYTSIWESRGFIGKSILIMVAISIMSSLSSFFGRHHAKLTIEGYGVGITFIKIKTKTKITDIDNNNNLILIIHNDKKYYLVNQENPAPLNPFIYVIPDDQVEFVVLNKSVK